MGLGGHLQGRPSRPVHRSSCVSTDVDVRCVRGGSAGAPKTWDGPEKTREELMESLRTGAEAMLATEVAFEPQATMTLIDVPSPAWAIG